jgi:hypothetical protein
MKRISITVLVIVLALLTACLMPVQVFADSMPDYICEVKIFEGNYDNAEKEGYILLKGDDNKPVDLNQGSGSKDLGAKGNKAVYMGYKTTKDKNDAITDLALMSMKGGYDVAEYDRLMEGQMSQQIVPFVDGFLAAINEYRENYDSDIEANQQRAQFIHDVLNKFTDDDCGGAGLGDLLLNETVYEMAKPKWDALTEAQKEKTSFYAVNVQVRDSLPEAEKNNHADILTIIAQSNGKITLALENLLTRAADTNEETWLERFENTTYEDMLDFIGGDTTDNRKELTRQFGDVAQTILEKWDAFQQELVEYKENVKTVENFDEKQAEEVADAVENIDENTDEQEAADALTDYAEQQVINADLINKAQSAAIHDILADIAYLDDTMLEFFSMTKEEVEADITLLYPLAASLTEGQIAGLEFLSLRDMFAVALTTAEGYEEIELDDIDACSVYDGVDRGIYQKGGVALTSDAFRADALEKMAQEKNDKSIFSTSTIAMIAVSGVCALGALASFAVWSKMKIDIMRLNGIVEQARVGGQTTGFVNYMNSHPEIMEYLDEGGYLNQYADDYAEMMAPKTSLAGKLAIGLTVAAIVFGAVTTYLAYKDMKAYYNVEFTPIPHYMVDAKDLIGYNSNGEQIVLKNQSAYYKAVESNRTEGADYYKKIGTCADMNGCVNPQWLALYAAKNEAESPILASSLKVVVGSNTIPEGYNTGIHFFGEKAAFNLNNKLYCWNQNAKSIMVYFKVDDTPAASTTGSNFTTGTLALAGVGGLALGALATALVMKTIGKRKNNKPAEA